MNRGIALETMWHWRDDSIWYMKIGRAEQAGYWAKKSAHIAFLIAPELRENSNDQN